jgi:glycosyltransferase involved in cell wall biosynthesis
VTARRVALVSEHASPLAPLGGVDAGGQNVYVAALGHQLARAGCAVTVYTRRDDADLPAMVEVADGLTVVHIDAGPAERIAKDDIFPFVGVFARRLLHAWRATPPDVIHSHFWMSGWASACAARRLDIPVLHTYHALGAVKRRHQLARDTSPRERDDIERALLRKTSGVIATCSDEVRELVDMGGDRRRIHVIPCGVDIEHFVPSRAAARRPDAMRVVSIGRLVPRKGVDDVVRALASVPDAELVVAGGPPSSMLDRDPEVRRLRGIARAAGVIGRVRFVGSVSRDDVAALLRSADVVACTPWYEPFGIVPLEAAACGVPVIGTAVGGLLDTVEHGRTGLLVPPRSPDSIAAALRELAADPVRRQRMGCNAARRARSLYSWERIGAAMLACYESHVVGRTPTAEAVPA